LLFNRGFQSILKGGLTGPVACVEAGDYNEDFPFLLRLKGSGKSPLIELILKRPKIRTKLNGDEESEQDESHSAEKERRPEKVRPASESLPAGR
jgi:hypothetical protein